MFYAQYIGCILQDADTTLPLVSEDGEAAERYTKRERERDAWHQVSRRLQDKEVQVQKQEEIREITILVHPTLLHSDNNRAIML